MLYRLRDRWTPKSAKWLLGLLFRYVLTPFDLIADCIPVPVCLDGLVIVPGLLWAAGRITPKEVLADCRKQALASVARTCLVDSITASAP